MQNTMQTFPAAAAAVAAGIADASPSPPPDFDFQMPCRYFKSSFARSLSLNNNNNSNGNGSSVLALPKKSLQIEAKQQQQQQQQEQHKEVPCSLTPPPALPARRYTTTSSNNNNNNLAHFNAAPTNQLQQQQQQQQQLQRNLNLAVTWSLQDASHVAAPNNNNNNLPQQPAAAAAAAAAAAHEQTLNVEAVILQNQVDTLQWQLKQTETNCEMYRAVMEEVARFFERYQQQQQQLQQQQLQLQQLQQQQRQQQTQANRHSLSLGLGEQISRSKSLHHVQGLQSEPNGGLEDAPGVNSCSGSAGSSANSSASYLRARSSTNLLLNKSMLAISGEHSYESIAPAGSYNAFKDFTWRRSPKKFGGCKARLSSPEAAEEKLNQEAFRLARTIRNLLHTSQQQPDLTQPRHSMLSLGAGCHRLCKNQKLLAPQLHNSTGLDAALGSQDINSSSLAITTTNNNNNSNSNNNSSNSNAEMLFLRANTMRDSRLSLRSSTDSSVHSTISSTASSSSKIETDEEIAGNKSSNNNMQSKTAASSSSNNNNNNNNGSSTEDESGFSSISSFHDVGLPLSSTLIGGTNCRLSLSTESRNSTLKSALNGVGVPLQPLQTLQPLHSPSGSSLSGQTQMQSPAKTYRNANRYQRFSTLSNEDAAAVLWV